MEKQIKSIFKNFEVNGKSIPVEHLRYKGKSKTYVIWTIISEVPSLSADDDDLYSVTDVDIHIYSDGNYLDIVKEVKKLMKDNNWSWLEDSTEMYEDDTELYHKTITFEKERMINNG